MWPMRSMRAGRKSLANESSCSVPATTSLGSANGTDDNDRHDGGPFPSSHDHPRLGLPVWAAGMNEPNVPGSLAPLLRNCNAHSRRNFVKVTPDRGTLTKVTLFCVLPYGATSVGTSGVPTKLSCGPHRQLRLQQWSGTSRVAIFMPAGVASGDIAQNCPRNR
jgi:hypothetical protein